MVRRATPEDASAAGRIFVRARDLMTYLRRIPDEDRQGNMEKEPDARYEWRPSD